MQEVELKVEYSNKITLWKSWWIILSEKLNSAVNDIKKIILIFQMQKLY